MQSLDFRSLSYSLKSLTSINMNTGLFKNFDDNLGWLVLNVCLLKPGEDTKKTEEIL